MPHIDDQRIDEYATGRLTDSYLAEVEEHLLVCPECQARLEQADQFVALFRAAYAVAPASRPSWKARWFTRRRWWPAATAIAAFVAVLALAVSVRLNQPGFAMVVLSSPRGPESPIPASAGKPLRLVFDVPATAAGRVEIVDFAGRRIAEIPSQVRDGRATAQVVRLKPGAYWVRVYGKAAVSELLAEYSLRAE